MTERGREEPPDTLTMVGMSQYELVRAESQSAHGREIMTASVWSQHAGLGCIARRIEN